jgi:hypothetical protein
MIFIYMIIGFSVGFILGWQGIVGMTIGAVLVWYGTNIAINNFFRNLRKPGGKEGP